MLKYPRTPYWPTSPSMPADALHIEHPESFLHNPVVVTEKLDGSNTLLYRGNVYGRSILEPSEAKWYGMVKKWHAWKTLSEEDVMIYGEDIYGVHSIVYDPVPENATFYVFGMRVGEEFVDWSDMESKMADLDIPVVPVLFKGQFDTLQEINDFVMDSHGPRSSSQLGGETEGIVIRMAGSFDVQDFAYNVCKSVRPDHVQPHVSHWRKRWNPCEITPVNTNSG